MEHNTAEIAAIRSAAEQTTTPLSTLVLSEKNQARTQHDETSLASLAATILVIGLLQNLVVTRANGKFQVAAGGRRLRALLLLLSQGKIADDYPVRVLILADEHAHLASLIENEAREAMHPADTFMAYKRLHDDGMSMDAIATANGVSLASVRKHLALGDVSPKLVELFRQGKAKMEDMQALAGTTDHARQEAAWKASADNYYRAGSIRQMLSEKETAASSRLARYVTLSGYKAAGGEVRKDLFAQKGEDVFLADPELLQQLAREKVERSGLWKEARGEGWAWVDFCVEWGHEERRPYGEVKPTHVLSPEATEKLAALKKEQCDAREAMSAAAGTDAAASLRSRLNEIWDELQAVNETAAEVFPDEIKTCSGVMLHLDHTGRLVAHKGLIRAHDRGAAKAILSKLNSGANESGSEGSGGNNTSATLPKENTRPAHSAALVESLRAEQVTALQAELVARPTLTVCLHIQQLLIDLEHSSARRYEWTDTFAISASSARSDLTEKADGVMESPAGVVLQQYESEVLGAIPRDPAAALSWLLEQSETKLMQILAVLLAQTVYRRTTHGDAPTKHLDRLTAYLPVPMATWWTPRADNYFSRVPKTQMTKILSEVNKAEHAPRIQTMKKKDAATEMEQLMAGTNWIPEEFRTAGAAFHAKPTSERSAAAMAEAPNEDGQEQPQAE